MRRMILGGLCVAFVATGLTPAGRAAGPDITKVYVAGFDVDVLYEIDPATQTVTPVFDGPLDAFWPSSLLFTPGGGLLLSTIRGPVGSSVFRIGRNGAIAAALQGDPVVEPFGANGLAFDAAGRLYVSMFDPGEIIRFSTDGSFELFADRDDGISFADGLAFDANGDLFVANRKSFSVLKISPEGDAKVFDEPPCDPFSIDIRSNSDIYISCVSGDVYRYAGGDPEAIVHLGTYTSGTTNTAIRFSRDESSLYFTSCNEGQFLAIDPDSGIAEELVPPGGLLCPLSIGVFDYTDAARLTTTGACPGRVSVDLTGVTPAGRVALLGAAGPGSATLAAGPCAGTEVALDDPTLLRVVEVDLQGSLQREFDADELRCGTLLQAVDLENCVPTPVAIVR